MAKNVLGNTGRALNNTAKVASAVVFRNFKAASTTVAELIKFFHTGRGFYLSKFA